MLLFLGLLWHECGTTVDSTRLIQIHAFGPARNTDVAALPVGRHGCFYNHGVASETETIMREALALRDEERADLAAELLASLDSPPVDDPAAIRSLWADELERRAARVLSGDVSTEDWPTVRDRVADRLRG